ncbi:MAG: Crp/Fnr family transcriptional regulator [Leptospiraceae bacterium]|nr:Crp/Fnr family transcriptional regulator [Leptospiraceae bacterium]
MTLQEFTQIFPEAQHFKIKRSKFIFYEGDKPAYCDFLISGNVQIFKYDSNANEITLNYFTDGSIIAELAVIENIEYPATARCISDVELLRCPISEFHKKLKENVDLNQLILKSLLEKMKILNLTINRTLTMDSLQRVSHFLYHFPLDTCNLKHHQIASMLALRPETFSRALKILRETNAIEVEKTCIKLLQKEKLIEFF